MRRALVALALAGCPRPVTAPAAPLVDVAGAASDSEQDHRARLIAELQDDILSSYQRDELPELETQLIDPTVGPARIGVGPGDVLFGDEVRQRASSRWPLRIDPLTPSEVRSKRLDIHLAVDKTASAAWMSDELSWRLTFCGHKAVIPLRVTALYAHDGDRWVQVFEHLSFARVPMPSFDGELVGRQVEPVVAQHDRALVDALSGKLAALFSRQLSRVTPVVARDPDHRSEEDPRQPAPTLLLAPDADSEWHGDADLSRIAIVDGKLNADDRRVGTVGPSVAASTIAYWVGNFIADMPARPGIPAGRVRLRGTFVFEKRPPAAACDASDLECKDRPIDPATCSRPHNNCQWVVVQGHVSQPIADHDLANTVFGTSLESANFEGGEVLRVGCDDGRRAPATPAAGPSGPAPGADSR